MRLYHFSPARVTDVLDPECSCGRLKAVWLATSSRLAWAFCHTADHKGTTKLFLHTVNVPRSQIRRRRRGIYTCNQLVKVASVVRFDFAQIVKEVMK